MDMLRSSALADVDLPDWRKLAQGLHARFLTDGFAAGARFVTAVAEAAQRKLEADYPQLFVSDDAIKQKRAAARKALKNDPTYKAIIQKRAAAYRAQQDYLHNRDKELGRLKQRLDAAKQK